MVYSYKDIYLYTGVNQGMRPRVANLLIIQVLYHLPPSISVVPSKVIKTTSGWSTLSHRNPIEFLDTQMLLNLRRTMSHSVHSQLPTLVNSTTTPDRGFSCNTQWSPTSQQRMEGPELVNPPGEVNPTITVDSVRALRAHPVHQRYLATQGVSIDQVGDSGEVEVLTAVCNTVGSVRYRAVDVHEAMCAIFRDIYCRCGGGYTESFYQKAVLRAAYLKGLPVMMERDLFADFGDGSLLAGRVDLEVAGVCLYELKIGSPKILVDSKQVKKYLKTYDANKEDIQIASLVYFGTGHVFIHNVRDRIDSGRSVPT
jgi:hypothetical protein